MVNPLRILNETDAESFQKVRLQALKECPEAFGSSFIDEEILTPIQIKDRLKPSTQRFIFGVFNQEILVGFCGFYQHSGTKLLHRGTIWGLYVSPEVRGRHLGRLLIEALIDSARQCKKLEEILISVTVGNNYVRHLYISLGFTHRYIEPRYLKINGAYFDAEHLSFLLPS